MIIAVSRHYSLFYHYNVDLCCYCYQQALEFAKQIFEWQTCEYDYNIKDPNQICLANTPWQNPQNLSTNYNLFHVDWYYFVMASFVFGIAVVYIISTYIVTRKVNAVDALLTRLPLEFMLSCNVFMSTITFYQFTLNYQFFPDSELKIYFEII